MGIAALHLVHELNNLSILDVSKIVTSLLRVSSFRNSPVLSPMTRIDPSLASGACSEGRSPGAIKTSFRKKHIQGETDRCDHLNAVPNVPIYRGGNAGHLLGGGGRGEVQYWNE